jgi:hypothetical protein
MWKGCFNLAKKDMKHAFRHNYVVVDITEDQRNLIVNLFDKLGLPVYPHSHRYKPIYPNLCYDQNDGLVGLHPMPLKGDYTYLSIEEFIGCIYGIEPERFKQPEPNKGFKVVKLIIQDGDEMVEFERVKK